MGFGAVRGIAAAAIAACIAGTAAAAGTPPHLGEAGLEGYRDFQVQSRHKAFAVAPGGAWSWRADLPTAAEAGDAALRDCAEHTEQQCVLYAVDDETVFDRKAWTKLWGPYRTRAEAARSPVGKRRGERFPDLAVTDPSGKPIKISDLRGKVVLLHFWGTWCPPCRREMPELQALVRALAGASDIRPVLLQMREDARTARSWADARHIRLPLYDSGAGEGGDALTLSDGSRIGDRELATVFPTTFVLDKHGIVLFSHQGPVSGWLDYLPFLRDAAERSGKLN